MRIKWSAMVIFVISRSVPGVGRADEPYWPAMPYTRHAEYQAVNEYGEGTFPTVDPVRMRGVLINRGGDLLDPTPGADPFMGGQWQVFFRAVGDDWGGTACWMGQNIGYIWGDPSGNYSDEEWLAEIDRLEHDPATGHYFQPGDLIEVRARAPGLFYGGKTNVNEKHQKDPALNFDIVLLQAAYGLIPTPLGLADVKDADNQFIFDRSRITGAERFQGTLVEIDNVTFVDTAGWGPDAELTIQDGSERDLPVLLGLGEGFSLCSPPSGPVDLVGVFDQEALHGGPYTEGYHLWIPDATDYVRPHALIRPGDLSCDGVVNVFDIDPFVLALTDRTAYSAAFPCCLHSNADCNGDNTVNVFDIDPFVQILTGL